MPRFALCLTALCLLLLTAAAPVAAAGPAWTDTFGAGFDASYVAMGPDGTTVYYGVGYFGGSYQAAAQVRPPGGPLGAVQKLSPSGANVNGISVAAGKDGHFLAAWAQDGVLQLAVLAPGATSFSAAQPVAVAGQTAGSAVSVAVDAAGNGLVLWSSYVISGSNSSSSVLFTPVSPSGVPGSTQTVDSAGPTANEMYNVLSLGVASDDAGDAIAGWYRSDTNASTQDETLSVKTALRTAGHAFGAATTLDSAFNSNSSPGIHTSLDGPSVAMTPSGAMAITWGNRQYNGGQTNDVLFRSGTVSGGLEGSNEHPATSGGTLPNFPTVALAPDGRAVVTFFATIATAQRLQAAFKPAGGTFDTVQTLNDDGKSAEYPSLATSPGGDFVLGWPTYDNGTGKNAVFVAVAPAGGTFTATPIASGLQSPSVAVAAGATGGDAVLIWRYFSGSAYATDSKGYDVSGPLLTNVQIPATATASQPTAFSVKPIDIWSPVSTVSWSFGDGMTADGAEVSHTYAAPGTQTVTVNAADALGHAATPAGGQVNIGPAPVGATPPDTTPPVVSAFKAAPATFAVGKAATPLAAKRTPRGTHFSFQLSEPAAVAIAISRQVPGMRSGRACKPAGRKKVAKRKRCIALKRVGAFKRSGKLGVNSVAFSGRVGKRALGVGRYRARLVATDAAHNASRPAVTRFRIVSVR